MGGFTAGQLRQGTFRGAVLQKPRAPRLSAAVRSVKAQQASLIALITPRYHSYARLHLGFLKRLHLRNGFFLAQAHSVRAPLTAEPTLRC